MRTSTNFYLFNLALADIIIILMGEFIQINSFTRTESLFSSLCYQLLPMIS